MAAYFSDNQDALFKALANGSEQALERIVQLNEKLLLREIKQILHSEVWVKEVWSDTIQALWEHKTAVAEKANPIAWLVVTARHKAINKIRDEKRNLTFPMDLFPDMQGPGNVELEMEAKEFNALIERAVQMLSPGQREVYTLKIKNGLNRKEIAKHLNLSEHTVKNQLSNAMLSLRKHLAKLMHTILI